MRISIYIINIYLYIQYYHVRESFVTVTYQ